MLAVTGVLQILQTPAILGALDPRQAFEFFHARGWKLFVVMGLALFTVMATWRLGKERLTELSRGNDLALLPFVESLAKDSTIPRSRRIAVYPSSHPDTVPSALLHNLKHYQVLHECNVLVSVRFLEVPHVAAAEQLTVEALPGGFWQVRVDYGFKDKPNLPLALGQCARHDLQFDPFQASYFLSREVVVPSDTHGAEGMAPWRRRLFSALVFGEVPQRQQRRRLLRLARQLRHRIGLTRAALSVATNRQLKTCWHQC